MVIILIENREKVFKLISIKLFQYTVVLQSIAVFFSTIFYSFRYLFTLEEAYIFFKAFRFIRMLYFFAHNCEICFIRGPPVQFEHKKSDRTGGKNKWMQIVLKEENQRIIHIQFLRNKENYMLLSKTDRVLNRKLK